eukprot:Seg2160.4 transcript_id=Seg2160.4/GoldUCD/mRNA.D3Y31 product="Protein arginine N-methyltransferase 5" protein_id=Seg2160.4/GoldUCD/D3Y31
MANPASAHVSCGRDLFCVPDLRIALQTANQSGFDFICTPLAHPRFKREFEKDAPPRPGAFTRSDLLLPGSDWSSLIVGKISPWIDVESKDEQFQKNSLKALNQEISFACHLSLPSLIMKLKRPDNIQLGQVLNSCAFGSHLQQIWIQVPIRSEAKERDHCLIRRDLQVDERQIHGDGHNDTWHWWNQLRLLCDQNRKIGLVLELNSRKLPTDTELDRWFAEPIKAVCIPAKIFMANKKGYPVLSKQMQEFIRRLFKLNVQFIISGTPQMKNIEAYYQYLDHIFVTQPTLDSVAQFAKGYEDYLQAPLQPLMDNLESQTYEVFEKDPIKYSQYEKAIYTALLDRVPEGRKEEVTTIIMVVGAGRGPLVRASFEAAKKADRKVKMYAVEKNQNAIVTLETLNVEEWKKSVTVVSSDMRDFNPTEKADILVSELLGSFGDNELSPECLDGAQNFLKDDGISIPCEYTSYVAPMMSMKLHTETGMCKEAGKSPEACYETPYVVRLHNVNIASEPQKCFTFVHPNDEKPIDNTRYSKTTFHMKTGNLIHGIAGYFDAVLYDDVSISIHPETHSEGMFSWFPIYFPIKTPLLIPDDSDVSIHFWRKSSRTKVWYEWCIVQGQQNSNIHNANGRSYFIGL